jgi:hypothetical protein
MVLQMDDGDACAAVSQRILKQLVKHTAAADTKLCQCFVAGPIWVDETFARTAEGMLLRTLREKL